MVYSSDQQSAPREVESNHGPGRKIRDNLKAIIGKLVITKYVLHQVRLINIQLQIILYTLYWINGRHMENIKVTVAKSD